jgi:protein required for attachment to host cells
MNATKNAIKKTTAKSITWVVVTDGGKALFFVNSGAKLAPRLELGAELNLDNPRTRDQGADRPGRYNDAMGHRTSIEETDWHRLAKVQFADTIADKINSAALNGDFQSLILYADAATLGELRKRFHKEAAGRVVFEETLDLTGHPVADIEKRVREVFLPGA